MALANFFDKAALAAAQILQDFDRAAFEARLTSSVVGLAFDDAAVESEEGATTLELAMNLLARLYPRVALVCQGERARRQCDALIAQARLINPAIEIEQDHQCLVACLVVGGTPPPVVAPVIYVGSDGWIVRVSSQSPRSSGNSSNPFGAGAAACFGAANLFRLLFGEALPGGEPDHSFSLSLLDMNPTASAPLNPDLGTVDLGECFLVGLGAIGNGAVWALARVPGLHGVLHLVDAETIDLTNLQRYVLASQGDVGRQKVALAAELLKSTELDTRTHPLRWGEYLRRRGNWSLPTVAVAVDSAQDRAAIQAALPRWVVNGWTQPDDLGISRHEFLGEQACLMCLYLPETGQPDEDQLVADAIGLADERMEVRRLLYTGDPVGQPFMERIAAALQIPVEPLLAFQDRPLRAFYTEAVCGGVVLRLGAEVGRNQRTEVPMAFQSALAGILLVAELAARAGGLRPSPLAVETRINLLRPLAAYLSFARAKHPSGQCICQDEDYVIRYRTKYPPAGV